MIQNNPEKVKRGQSYLLNGETVWIERQMSKTEALVCFNEARGLEDRYETVKILELKPVKKSGSSIQAKPKKQTEKEKTDTQLMNEFFLSLHDKIPFNCTECGKPLYAINNFAKRAVCCHIIPKSLFPSVARNEDNIIFMGPGVLGICHDHDTYDSSVEKRVKMKVYPLALEKFNKFKHLLNDKDYIDACDYLGIDWQR